MISAREIEGVRKALKKLDDNTRKKALEIIDRVGLEDHDMLFQALFEELSPICSIACDVASGLASACYNAWRFAELGETIETVNASVYDQVKMNATIGTAVAKARDGGTIEQVLDIVSGRIAYDIRTSYGDTLFANGNADKRKPRFARVTQGDSCDFCLMLASRGFVHHNGKQGEKAHNHANCDCIYVASWTKHPSVENYDPDALYRKWKDSDHYEYMKRYAQRKRIK